MPTELVQKLRFFIDLNAKGFKAGGKNISKTMLDMSNKLKANDSGFAKFAKALNIAQREMLKLQKAYAKNNINSKQLQIRQKNITKEFGKSIPKSKEFRQSLLLVVDAVKRTAAAEEKLRAIKEKSRIVEKRVASARKAEVGDLSKSRNALTRRTKAIIKSIKASGLEGEALKQLKGIVKELIIKRKILDAKEKAGIITRKQATSATKKLNASLIDLQVRGFRGGRKALQKYSLGLKSASAATIRMGGATTGLMRFFSRWRNRLLVLTFALAGLIRAIKGFVRVAIDAEKQTIALGIVALKTGNSVESITKAAKELSKDGVLSFVGAAQAIKNLISTGATIGVVVANLQAMKDAALANGRASFTAEQNIIAYTQGVKENKSVLTDSAGIMTNISVLLKRAAKNTSDLSLADKLLIEFTKEAGLFTGTLSKSLETLGGQLQVGETAVKSLSIQLGKKLVPATKILLAKFLEIIESISKWVEDTDKLEKAIKEIEKTIINFIEVTKAFVEILILLGKALNFIWNIIPDIDKQIVGVTDSLKDLSKAIEANKILSLALGIVPVFTELKDKVKEVKEEVKELVGPLQAVINVPEMQRLRTMMEDISKSVKEREKNTNELRASIAELSGFERKAFIMRSKFNLIERRNEIDLLKLKLNSIAILKKKEREFLLEQLRAVMKQLNDFRTLPGSIALIGGLEEVARLSSEIQKLQKSISSIDKSTESFKGVLAALNEELKLSIEQFKLLLLAYDDDIVDNISGRIDKIAESFSRLRSRIVDDLARMQSQPQGANILSFGAPRATAALRREDVRHDIRLRDIQELTKKRRDIIDRDFAKGIISEIQFRKEKREIWRLSDDLELLELKIHGDRKNELEKAKWEERLQIIKRFASKAVEITLFQSIRDRNNLATQSAVARQNLDIDLAKGIVSREEFGLKTQQLNKKIEILQQASDIRRNISIREAIASELAAKAVLWAIQGPIDVAIGLYRANPLQVKAGLAQIAGAVAAGLATSALLGSIGGLQTQAALLENQAGRIGEEGSAFEGQGRTITGSFSAPLGGGFSINPTVIINADVVGIGSGGIEETESALENIIVDATKRAVDSGEIVISEA